MKRAEPLVIANVDDTEEARYAKQRILRHAGFEVVDARNGAEAIAVIERLQPPLVLLDVRLPDISGLDVCKVIKERWPTTLVLQTSATYITAADRAHGLDVGADAYLIEPFDPVELVAAVRALLRLHSAEEATRTLNTQLEQRIAERTGELLDANVALLGQIAQRERAEATLVHAQKMEAMGHLTGAVAHDFNNVLASITGYLHVLKVKVGDESLRGLADKALGAAGRGAKLTQRLLAFSRTQRLVTEPIDVAQLLSSMRDWLAQSVGSAIELDLTVPPGELFAMTDGNQLELAVLNLVLNSRDAMPQGGRIGIEARARVLAESDGELAAGDYVQIDVRDNGLGMEREVAARAFDPFYTTKPVGAGTGLGLAQVFTLGRQSGGTARLDSAPGRGTTITLWLRAVSAEERARRATGPALHTGAPGSVLVVDDDPDMRELVSGLLSDAGYRVQVAVGGVEALQQLQRAAPDVLMLDLSMPDMNGAEVATQARLLHPGLPVLFVSGHADIDAFEQAGTGAVLLRKPFRPAELLAALGRCLMSPPAA